MLEISVQKKYDKKRKILASEVNDKAIKKTDVNELLKQIADAEHAMDSQVTSKSVKTLMELYQKAIEYYSALDNKCFEDFLGRMTNLFKREEIQKALAQNDEEEKSDQTDPAEKADTSVGTAEADHSGDQLMQDAEKDVIAEESKAEESK